MTQKNPALLQKLNQLDAVAEDDEEIVSNLIPQDDSYNSDKSKDHIITNYTAILVLIFQTG